MSSKATPNTSRVKSSPASGKQLKQSSLFSFFKSPANAKPKPKTKPSAQSTDTITPTSSSPLRSTSSLMDSKPKSDANKENKTPLVYKSRKSEVTPNTSMVSDSNTPTRKRKAGSSKKNSADKSSKKHKEAEVVDLDEEMKGDDEKEAEDAFEEASNIPSSPLKNKDASSGRRKKINYSELSDDDDEEDEIANVSLRKRRKTNFVLSDDDDDFKFDSSESEEEDDDKDVDI
ncbi:unnamed protein product [Ambrosiozyma monospora]|uniref:Unnamed protein product n=1 Tax=Ambrosiozyma monospora TaxID=43982 RepID=A0ACB5TFB3_AMBMO|nr:unnamed protein product [Ambrosiozyma monospora]